MKVGSRTWTKALRYRSPLGVLSVEAADEGVFGIVPCHRVVQAAGRLGGYAAGSDAKRWLLAHEAGHAPALRPSR